MVGAALVVLAIVVVLEVLDGPEVVELAAAVLLDGADVVVVVDVGVVVVALLGAAVVVVVVVPFGHLVSLLIFSRKSGFCRVSFLWHSLASGANLQKILSFQASKSPILLLIFFRNRSSRSGSFTASCLSLESALDFRAQTQFGFLFL